jgi:hypothetical protein
LLVHPRIRCNFNFETCTKLSLEILRCITLCDYSIFDNANSVAYIVRFFNMLSRDEYGSLLIFGNLFNQSPYFLSRPQVKIRRRLIQYYEFSFTYERHSNGQLSSCTWRNILNLFINVFFKVDFLLLGLNTFINIFFLTYSSKFAH